MRELHEQSKVATQHMKTLVLKEILGEIYNIIICFVGLVALYILCHQIDVLGDDVFNAERKPVSYDKAEYNLANLLLFGVISVSGIVYGAVGMSWSLRRLIKSKDT